MHSVKPPMWICVFVGIRWKDSLEHIMNLSETRRGNMKTKRVESKAGASARNTGLLLRSLLVLYLKLQNLERRQTKSGDVLKKAENSLYFSLLFNHQQEGGEGNEIFSLFCLHLYWSFLKIKPNISPEHTVAIIKPWTTTNISIKQISTEQDYWQ